MAISILVVAIVSFLHIFAFVFAIGAEMRRSTGKVVADEYDDRTYCVYDTDASTVYGLSAFVLVLLSQALVTGVAKCLCCGRGLTPGASRTCAVFFFVLSWLSFVVAEACLLAGSAKNAYHTKYRGYFGKNDLSCAALRKGLFAAAAAMVLLSLVCSLLFYWCHSKANTSGWQKHENEGLNMNPYPHPYPHTTEDMGKL